MLSTTTRSDTIMLGKDCALKSKTFGSQCFVYEKLLPELYDSLAWCTESILIIMKSGIFDL